MDRNAHVLTQCEMQLQCECAKNSGKISIFCIWIDLRKDTHAHVLKMRFKLMMMIIIIVIIVMIMIMIMIIIMIMIMMTMMQGHVKVTVACIPA